jgi:hypothetical protein
MARHQLSLSFAIAAASLGCATTSTSAGPSDGGSSNGGYAAAVGSPSGSSGSGGSAQGAGGSSASGAGGSLSAGGGGIPGCASGAELMYLIGESASGSVIYRFDPSALAFEKLGAPSGCPAASSTWPANMALARNGKATLAYYTMVSDSSSPWTVRLYELDIATMTCTDSGSDLTHPAGLLSLYGLTFIPDPTVPDEDVLYASLSTGYNPYVGGAPVCEISTLDLGTFSTVGGTDSCYKLSATADGRLYGFSQSFGPDTHIAELNPTTAEIITKQLVVLPHPWATPGNAFAFWGGELWAFSANSIDLNASTTTVFQIVQATGEMLPKTTLSDFYVMGAVVSPCAPLEPPA